MTNSTTSLEPGWRPDPSGRYEFRYWDGQWTNRVANSSPGAAPAAATAAGPAAAPPAASAAPASRPAPMDTAPPPPASALAVAAAVSPAPAAFAPFGVDDPAALRATPAPTQPGKVKKPKVGLFGRIRAFFRSFVDEDESYKSPLSGPQIESHHPHALVMQAPASYGRAGIVALAAGGLATGAYLPWLTGTVDNIRFQQTGFDVGQGWGYWIGAAALAVAALLSVQMRKMRWVAMAVAIALTGLVIRDLLDTYDTMQRMNLAPNASVQIGTGLWIMVGSVAVAMIAGFRLGEDDKIV